MWPVLFKIEVIPPNNCKGHNFEKGPVGKEQNMEIDIDEKYQNFATFGGGEWIGVLALLAAVIILSGMSFNSLIAHIKDENPPS